MDLTIFRAHEPQPDGVTLEDQGEPGGGEAEESGHASIQGQDPALLNDLFAAVDGSGIGHEVFSGFGAFSHRPHRLQLDLDGVEGITDDQRRRAAHPAGDDVGIRIQSGLLPSKTPIVRINMGL